MEMDHLSHWTLVESTDLVTRYGDWCYQVPASGTRYHHYVLDTGWHL